MPKEYIEIVHVSQEEIGLRMKLGPRQGAIGAQILSLQHAVGVNYNLGGLDADPLLPKDTPILVGGGVWQWCVQDRVRKLRKLGYTNVTADRTISFALEDGYKDAGIETRHPLVSKNLEYW